MLKQCVIGLKGLELTPQEIIWLKEKKPKGVILFARNIASAEQVKNLLQSVREHIGEHCWAAIDEEGGRVNRLPWPPFNNRTQAIDFEALFNGNPDHATKKVYDEAFETGKALKELGFTHNCAPVLDIFFAEGDPVIGNRAYSNNPEIITILATAYMQGLHDAGIDAIGKHFPGHGRANADSHLAMPEVHADLATILKEADAFPTLFAKGLKHVMTAHVSYPQIDTDVATFSPFWLQKVLRDQLQFTGDIWSDDLCMKGCGMSVPDAARAAKKAGCDILLICEPDGVQAAMESL